MSHRCTDCRRPIPAGAAVIRSQLLERVAFHRSAGRCVRPLVEAR